MKKMEKAKIPFFKKSSTCSGVAAQLPWQIDRRILRWILQGNRSNCSYGGNSWNQFFHDFRNHDARCIFNSIDHEWWSVAVLSSDRGTEK